MSKDETRGRTSHHAVVLPPRKAGLFRYPGRDPVAFMTTELPGSAPTRDQRIRAGLRRLAHEGRLNQRG
jgi:hypothetical protein